MKALFLTLALVAFSLPASAQIRFGFGDEGYERGGHHEGREGYEGRWHRHHHEGEWRRPHWGWPRYHRHHHHDEDEE